MGGILYRRIQQRDLQSELGQDRIGQFVVFGWPGDGGGQLLIQQMQAFFQVFRSEINERGRA